MNNLNLIIGENSELVDFYLMDILSKIKYEEDSKIIFDMNTTSLSDVLDEASMISLFSNVKVIIGNNFDITKIKDNDYEYLSKYVINKNKDVYIIFKASKVDGRVKSYKLFKEYFNIIDTSKANNSEELIVYIKNMLNNHKYKMDQYDINYFIDKVGKDINNINSELNKLFIYKEDSKVITRDDIQLLVIDNIDSVIYEFTNAVIDKDMDTVFKMYDDFKKENVGIDYLIVSLSNVFRQSLIIKILSDDGKSNVEIAKIIGKKEFYVKKMLERLYMYTKDDLCNIISQLGQVDIDMKSGKSNLDELEMFLLRI